MSTERGPGAGGGRGEPGNGPAPGRGREGAAVGRIGDLAGAPPPRALYVHFPFCVRRCHYCDFSVARSARPPVSEWLACLEAEAAGWLAATGWRLPVEVETVFVGGGTPSLLGGEGMLELARLLGRLFAWDPATVEWTAEANPASLAPETCDGWRKAGVNRVSIGVQSFDDGALRWLGRGHDAAEAEAAVRRAGDAGLRDVSVDLIFGLPEEVGRDWTVEVERAASLGVTHVSAYGLTAEPRTPLGRRVELGRETLAGEETYEREYLAAAAALAGAGYVHYEVSNFARPGRECAHNWHYWDGSPYLGLGPSAHSYLPPFRIWNAYRWDAYRRAVRGGGEVRGLERLDVGARGLERLWLGLRTRAGIAEEAPGWRRAAADGRAAAWEARGWVVRSGGRARLTPAGWLRMDAIAADLAAGSPPAARGSIWAAVR